MLDFVWNWITANEELTALLAGASVLMLVGSLGALPFAVRLLPADYFYAEERRASPLRRNSPALHVLVLAAKNLTGGVLLLGGLAMLVLPGQGLLTLLVATLLLDFPGKYHLERRIIGYPRVISTLNWLRSRTGAHPLRVPPDLQQGGEGEASASGSREQPGTGRDDQ
ncbi:hypothetical protein [Thiohalorhabdus methylotrophus]|uniref:Transmembrane protein (PGPGW) n=1 Tax=Thiohalorhabdus methylotrophus TaxID=3242694 RepID=A0ABV4TTP6_9GAMM